ASIINIVEDFLRKAFRGNYPIEVDQLAVTVVPHWPERFNDASEIVIAIDSLVRELEAKLDVCPTHT
ncbi:MAG: restriction endonuclease, partial [Cyanobacteriota bacterium]